MPQETDPFSEFGGSQITLQNDTDPFAEFGGSSLESAEKKNPVGSSSQNGSQGLQDGTPSQQRSVPSKPLVGLGGEDAIAPRSITEPKPLAQYKPIKQLPTGEKFVEKDFFGGNFGAILKSIDAATPLGLGEFIDDIGRSISSGYKQGQSTDETLLVMAKGKNINENDLQKYMEAVKVAQDQPMSDAMYNFNKSIEEKAAKNENGKADFWDVFTSLNAGVVPEIVLSSFSAMMNPASATAAGGAVAGGTAVGGAVGAVASAPLALAAAGTTLETASTFNELLKSELEKDGKDFTKENVRTILEDPKRLSQIRSKAAGRGLTIGIVDAITGKLGGAIGAKIAKGGTKGATTLGALATTGTEAIGGSAGEAAGQVVAGQEISPQDIVLEGIGEIGTAPIQFASAIGADMSSSEILSAIRSEKEKKRQIDNISGRPSYEINGETVSKETVDEIIDNMPIGGMEGLSVTVDNDNETSNKVASAMKRSEVESNIKKANPSLSDETVSSISELQVELDGLKGNDTEVAKKRASEIRAQIDEEIRSELNKRTEARQSALESREAKGIEPDVIDDIPEFVKTSVTRVEDGIPTSATQIDRASKWLYQQYKKIAEYKGNPDSPISQKRVSEILGNIGKDIEMLENELQTIREFAYSESADEISMLADIEAKKKSAEKVQQPVVEVPQKQTPVAEPVAAVAETAPVKETPAQTEAVQEAPITEPATESETNKIPAKKGTLAASFESSQDISEYVDGGSEVTVGDTKMTLIEKGNSVVELNKIVTPDDTKKGKGSARKALQELTARADEQGITLELNVAPEEGTSKEGLVKLYESQGFVADKGDMMRREPKKVETPKTETNAKEQQSGPLRSESKQEQPKGESDSNMPKIDRAELQDGKTPKEEIDEKREDAIYMLRDKLKAIAQKKFSESDEGKTIRLARAYNGMGNRERKSPVGLEIFAELQASVKEAGFILQPQKSGGFTVLNKDGKAISMPKKVLSKERRQEILEERRESEAYRRRILSSEPFSIEQWIAQQVARRRRFSKSDIERYGDIGSIPSWMYSENGISFDDVLENAINDGLGMSYEAEIDPSKIAMEIMSYASRDGDRRAFDFAERMYEIGSNESSYGQYGDYSPTSNDILEYQTLEELPDDVIEAIYDEIASKEEYETSEQYLTDIEKSIGEYDNSRKKEGASQQTGEDSEITSEEKLRKAKERLINAWNAKLNDGSLSIMFDPKKEGQRLADHDKELIDAIVGFTKEYINSFKDKTKVTVNGLKKYFEDLGIPLLKEWAEELISNEGLSEAAKKRIIEARNEERKISSQKLKDLRKSLNDKFAQYKSELKEKTRSEKAIVSDAKKDMQSAVRDSKIGFSNTQTSKIGRLISEVNASNLDDKKTELSEYLDKLIAEEKEREQKEAQKKIESEKKIKEKQQAAIERAKDEYATKGYRIGEAFGKLAGEIRGKAIGRKEGQKIGETIGKEKLQSFKERQRQFANDVKKALDTDLGNSITANQFRQIINAALKVNVDNENSINRFIDKVDKIIEDAQYYDKMDAMRKKQKSVKKRKHPQFQSVVNDFTSVDPEMIPDDMWDDYTAALEDASRSIPNYQKLIDMYYQVMQLKPKESESFPNYQILENKAEEIWDFLSDQKMRSISDYRKITKTISKFKKEARRLLGEESITQDQYDDLMEELENGINSVEKRFSPEIYSLKTDLIQFIFDREKSYSLTNIDLVEKDILKKINSLDNNQLRSLSIDELIDLSDIMEMVGQSGYVDIFHLSPILAKAQSANVGSEIKKQADKYGGVTDVQESLRKASLSDYGKSEAALGLGTNKYGAAYQHVFQPINKAASDMVRFVKEGIHFMGSLKKKHGIKKTEQTDRIGMFATYLREYGLGFDPKLKGIIDEDVNQEYGKRDWFKHIIEKYPAYLGKKKNKLALALFGAGKMDAITSAYNYMLERSGQTTLDPVDIYRSFIDNDGKYLPKNEVEYLRELLQWKEDSTRPLQEAANAMRGLPFNPVMFHIHRMRQGGTDRTIPKPEDVNMSKKGTVSMSSPTGKEVVSNKIGPIEFNMDRIITAENAMIAKDYYMTPALMRVNSAIKSARDAMGGTNATTETMSNIVQEMLRNEFVPSKSDALDKLSNNIRAAKAIKVFLSPLRTVREIGSSLIEYPLRSDVGYIKLVSNIIGKDRRGLVRALMLDTESTLLNRESIRKDFEIEAGEVIKKGFLSEKAEAMASLPERTMLIPIWLGVFQNKFKETTGRNFDENQYRTSEAYRRRFRKEINDSATFADGVYEDIAGVTSKAGQRREFRVPFTKQGASVHSTIGKEVAYLTGYNTRQVGRLYDAVSVIREAMRDEDLSKKDVVRTGFKEAASAIGIFGSSVFYGLTGTLAYIGQSYLREVIKGDEGDEEEKESLLNRMRDSLTKEGISEELLAAMASINLTRYGSIGRFAGLMFGSLAYSMSDDKELKESIKKYVRNVTYKDPVDFENMMQKGQYYEILGQVFPSLATLVELTYSVVKAYGGINKLKDKIANGEEIDEMDRAILALVRMTSTTINMFGAFFGRHIPTGIFEDMSKSMPVRTIDEIIDDEIKRTPEAAERSQRAKDNNAILAISEEAIKKTYKDQKGATIESVDEIPESTMKFIEDNMKERGLSFENDKSKNAKMNSFLKRYNAATLKRKDHRYMQIDMNGSNLDQAKQIARSFGDSYFTDENIKKNLYLMGIETNRSKVEKENGATIIMDMEIRNLISQSKENTK